MYIGKYHYPTLLIYLYYFHFRNKTSGIEAEDEPDDVIMISSDTEEIAFRSPPSPCWTKTDKSKLVSTDQLLSNDQWSDDVSLDSGVNLSSDLSLSPVLFSSLSPVLYSSLSPVLDSSLSPDMSSSLSPDMSSSLSPDMSSSQSPILSTSVLQDEDVLSESEDEQNSDISDELDNNFVSFRFDDYPDTVYHSELDSDIGENLTKEMRERPRRKSSIVNPAELYCSPDKSAANVGQSGSGSLIHYGLRRSQSIKSRL